MKEKENKKTKNRWFTAILYQEDKNYNTYLETIKQLYNYVTYIVHDKDVDENGEIKKKHTHIIFNVGQNARHVNSIAKEIGINPNMLEGCKKEKMLLYLIHYNNHEKTQYKIRGGQRTSQRRINRVNIQRNTRERKSKNVFKSNIRI